ncbi:hypothetical protein K502DRAFT_343917 [Neoconidiobolus thromboides FSU 785]|nr:hypothetical protein K502DRAFT_343917 [Neoconidiobolus thromboides FSU 785]
MLFVRENGFIMPNLTETNTVVEYYKAIDIDKFVDITKSRNVLAHFSIVYLGNEKYQYFNIHDITMNYRYSTNIKLRVTRMINKNINNIDELIQDKELPNKRPKVKTVSNFTLTNINGNKIQENKKYILKLHKEKVRISDNKGIHNNDDKDNDEECSSKEQSDNNDNQNKSDKGDSNNESDGDDIDDTDDNRGYEDYYEYDVIDVFDNRLFYIKMMETLKSLVR